MIIRVVIEWDESAQAYSATCPELNFISSFGDTKQEAISNLEDAIKLMLEPIPDNLGDFQKYFYQVLIGFIILTCRGASRCAPTSMVYSLLESTLYSSNSLSEQIELVL